MTTNTKGPRKAIRALLRTTPIEDQTCDICSSDASPVWPLDGIQTWATCACRRCMRLEIGRNTSRHVDLNTPDMWEMLDLGITPRRNGRLHIAEMRRLARIVRKRGDVDRSNFLLEEIRSYRLARGGRR